MKNRLVFVFLIVISQYSFACLNEYGFALDGHKIHSRYLYLSEKMLTFNKEDIQYKLDKLSRKVKYKNNDYKTWSDIATNLMKIGQIDSALHILQRLVYQNPNEYNLIANLGTAYELTGNIDSAFFYISKGISLNSKSHFNSEWIHKAILEAKLNIKQHKNWLNSHSILDLNDLLSKVKNDDIRGRKTEKVNQQIIYQIRTRAPFTPAPNLVLANILTTLGDFNTEIGTYENAILAYSYAMYFERPNIEHAKLKSKIKELNKKRAKSNESKENMPFAFKKMYKRSIFDPELLFLGLEDFAEGQAIFEEEFQIKNDSLRLLNQQITNNKNNYKSDLEHIKSENTKKLNALKNKGQFQKFLFLCFGLLGGVVLFYVIGKFKK